MVFDEVIDPITGDRGNAARLTPLSFWGAIALLSLVVLVATTVGLVT